MCIRDRGSTAGSLGGVAAAIMVPIMMGVNPVYAVVAGAALGGYGILPGFIAGYVVGFVAPLLEKYLPTGLDVIVGALCVAPVSYTHLVGFLISEVQTGCISKIISIPRSRL